MTPTQPSQAVEYRTLYEITGNIGDANTLLVPRAELTAARPLEVAPVTDEENEKFSRDVSNFKGSDPEATKFALEQFAASRVPVALPAGLDTAGEGKPLKRRCGHINIDNTSWCPDCELATAIP